jgi:hypothetical protein
MNLNKEFIFYSKEGVKQIKARALKIKDLGKPKIGFKDLVRDNRPLIEIKPSEPVVEELKEEEVSFDILKKQLFLRERLERLEESKSECKRRLDEIILKINSGEDLTQLRSEYQKVKNEVNELSTLEEKILLDYKSLPGEGGVKERLKVKELIKRLEEQSREGKISGEAYLQLKEEYQRRLLESEEKIIYLENFWKKSFQS